MFNVFNWGISLVPLNGAYSIELKHTLKFKHYETTTSREFFLCLLLIVNVNVFGTYTIVQLIIPFLYNELVIEVPNFRNETRNISIHSDLSIYIIFSKYILHLHFA